MVATGSNRKNPHWARWANVFLRGGHLAAVIMLGGGLLGAPVALGKASVTVAASGLALLALEIWNKPSYLRELAGIATLLKLLLLAWMMMDATLRPVLFWVIVGGSAIFAHAPSRFRHTVILGQNAPRED
jgi:hypothetical protein